MEACATAHDWGRAIEELGHAVRLLPPSYVKPFVERHENDAADAEAITEAAARPTMRFVPLETAEPQARGMIFRTRDLLVRQRTQLINDMPPAGGTSGSKGGAVGKTAQGAHSSPKSGFHFSCRSWPAASRCRAYPVEPGEKRLFSRAGTVGTGIRISKV